MGSLGATRFMGIWEGGGGGGRVGALIMAGRVVDTL